MTEMAVEGAFKVMSWDERPYDEAPGHPTFTHTRATHELTGGIQGEASICYLTVYRPDRSASFVGFVTVTGAIGARQGSFVMQNVGTYENGVAKGRWSVIPGLGTGALRGIRGDGHFAAGERDASYLLNVSF